MRKLLLFIFILMSFNVLAQTEWDSLGTSSSKSIFYIRKTYVSRGVFDNRPDIIKIWVMSKIPTKIVKGKTYYNVTDNYLFAIDVNTKEMASISGASYDSEMRTIDMGSSDISSRKYEISPPESIGDDIVKYVILKFGKPY